MKHSFNADYHPVMNFFETHFGEQHSKPEKESNNWHGQKPTYFKDNPQLVAKKHEIMSRY